MRRFLKIEVMWPLRRFVSLTADPIISELFETFQSCKPDEWFSRVECVCINLNLCQTECHLCTPHDIHPCTQTSIPPLYTTLVIINTNVTLYSP